MGQYVTGQTKRKNVMEQGLSPAPARARGSDSLRRKCVDYTPETYTHRNAH